MEISKEISPSEGITSNNEVTEKSVNAHRDTSHASFSPNDKGVSQASFSPEEVSVSAFYNSPRRSEM